MVRLWLRRYGDNGNIQRIRPGAKAIKYSPEFKRHRAIVSSHVENPFLPIRVTAINHNILVETARRHLHAAGIKNYKPAQKIALTLAHREVRVRFAQEYLNFYWEENVVIFY